MPPPPARSSLRRTSPSRYSCPFSQLRGPGVTPGPPFDRLALHRLDQPDHVSLGVVEHADRGALRDVHRTHDPRPAEALGLLQPRLDIVDGDVERHPAVASLLRGTDPTPDPYPLVEVALARDHPVVHRIVGVDLPPEQIRVEALE